MKAVKKLPAGVGMVEVLVALMVMGIGVMGFAALQLRSVETTSITYSRTQAMAIARDLVERINANPMAWPGGYDNDDGKWVAVLPAPNVYGCLNNQDCDQDEIATADVVEVRQIATAMLFDGDVRVEQRCTEDTQVACVKVSWHGTDVDQCDPDAVTATGPNVDTNCIIVEFWPQRATVAEAGGAA